MNTTARWSYLFTINVAICLIFSGMPLQGAQSDPNIVPLSDPLSITGEGGPTGLEATQSTAGPELLKRMKTLISVDFRGAPIEDVIKTLAEQADIDIVKGPTVVGDVTATLTDVPLDEAMQSIFTVHGFGYTTSTSIVRIVPIAELAEYETKYLTKIYKIDYADIETVGKMVKDMLSPKGKMAVNTETRHLIITDTEDGIEVIEELITEMDCEIPQILVEAMIYDVSCSAYLDLGFNWSAGTFTLFDSTTGLVTSGRSEPYISSGFSSGISQSPKSSTGLTLGVLNENVDLHATLTANRDDIKARLLANPKILVLNGQEALIKIVSEIPYQELTQTSGGGNIGTTKFKDVGVELTVTPQITRDNKIKLLLNPVFSVQTGTVALIIPTGSTTISSPQPIVDTREAQTQALIQDGETVVIGGLRKRDVVQEISKVPLLGDLPLLGALFRFRGEKAVNSELIVFITPHIIKHPKLTPSDIRKLDRMDGEFREPSTPTVMFDCGDESAACTTDSGAASDDPSTDTVDSGTVDQEL